LAYWAVVGNAKPGVDALIQLLENGNHTQKVWAIGGLQRLGPEARGAVPTLVKALKDPDRGVAYNAALALPYINPDSKEPIPLLIELLGEGFGGRIDSAKALAQLGPHAKEAIPMLIAGLTDKYIPFRAAASEALKRIDPEAAAKAGVK
jgi:HEAT repeat protein